MLALFAGQGALPGKVISQLPQWPLIIGLVGQEPDELLPEISFRLEHLGSVITRLKDGGVTEICFAGSIARPNLDLSELDVATAPLVPQILAAMDAGDNGALKAVIEIFEGEGIAVKGVADLAPGLSVGPEHTVGECSKLSDADVQRGFDVLAGLSSLDLGQACVVKLRQVLAVEAMGGTAWMLETLEQRNSKMLRGGVLIKGPKAQQDMRVDVPTIGPDTIEQAHRAGLDGIALVEGQVIVLDPEMVAENCQRFGLFLAVVPAP